MSNSTNFIDKQTVITAGWANDVNTLRFGTPSTSGGAAVLPIDNNRYQQDKNNEHKSVKDFGAIGDGITDDTAALTTAVAQAVAGNFPLFWPAGTYLTSASIPQYHSVTHFGYGAIQRGATIFYITPVKDSQTNTLYVSPLGNDSNDGLSSSQPMATLQRVCDVMQGNTILPRLAQGNWVVSMAAGTFTEGGVWSKFASCANPVVFVGQVDGSNVPTTILDGTSSSKTAGLYFTNGPSLITVQNVKANNWRANSVASGIVFANKGILQAYTINVWSNNNLWAGINADVISNWLVQGGTHTNNTNYGLRARGGVEVSIGYNGTTTTNRISISGSSSAAIQIWDNSAGHCDFVDISNCPTGIWLVNNSRTTHTNITMNTVNVGFNAQYGSTFDYDATSTFTSVNDLYQLTAASQSIGSTDLAGQMLTYDKFNNRYTTGVGQWGGSPFSSTVHAWASNKSGTNTFYYGIPNSGTVQMMWGTVSTPIMAYMQINSASPAYQWLLNGTVTLQHDTASVNPYRDNVASCGLAAARWTVVYAANGTINTSDAREKQQARPLSEIEKAVALKVKAGLKAFKWNDAVDKKGDKARWHFGVYAQEVADAFRSEGLDPDMYGLFCYDEWEAVPEEKDENGVVTQPARPAGNRYGIRYDELFAFILASI